MLLTQAFEHFHGKWFNNLGDDILCKLLNQGISKMTLCVPPHLHFYLFLQFFLMLCVRPTTFGHHQPRSPSCSPYDPLSTLNPAPTKFSCRQRNGQQNTTWTTIVICCMNIVAVFCYKSIYYYIGIIKKQQFINSIRLPAFLFANHFLKQNFLLRLSFNPIGVF